MVFHKFQIQFGSVKYRVCFFVAEVLPEHRGQNTVKGRLTQASKEKWRQALRGFFGGRSPSADPTASTSQIGE